MIIFFTIGLILATLGLVYYTRALVIESRKKNLIAEVNARIEQIKLINDKIPDGPKQIAALAEEISYINDPTI